MVGEPESTSSHPDWRLVVHASSVVLRRVGWLREGGGDVCLGRVVQVEGVRAQVDQAGRDDHLGMQGR